MRGIGTFLVLIATCSAVPAQVPETGRWQELAFASRAVNEHTARHYRALVEAYAGQFKLDDDPEVAARVLRVSATLLDAAVKLDPRVAAWAWEVHTSSSADMDALCMAGGKLLVSSHFVRRLQLDDDELAVLIGHEMAHAIAEHHRETLSEALHLSARPALPLEVMAARMDSDVSLQFQLLYLSHLQEREADHLGMVLAHHAGWSGEAMVRFYAKLAADEAPSALAGSHPRALSRLSMAKGMARLFSAR